MFRALALCAAVAAPVAAIAAMPMTPTAYVMKAGAGDLYEIQSSKLVMNSANPKLRDFAQMMVQDHTKSTADVKAAAMKAGLHPQPPMLNPMQSTMVANLGKVSGKARDQMYIEQQKHAHQQALALHENYSAHGTAAPLKMAAGNIVPVVKSHIQMLAAM
jgi:putative membrane protein